MFPSLGRRRGSALLPPARRPRDLSPRVPLRQGCPPLFRAASRRRTFAAVPSLGTREYSFADQAFTKPLNSRAAIVFLARVAMAEGIAKFARWLQRGILNRRWTPRGKPDSS